MDDRTAQDVRHAVSCGATVLQAAARFNVSRAAVRLALFEGGDVALAPPKPTPAAPVASAKAKPARKLPTKRLPREHRDAVVAAFLELGPHDCRWPDGEGVTMTYCRAPVSSPGSKSQLGVYCKDHFARLRDVPK
jgi:hypothetical protein